MSWPAHRTVFGLITASLLWILARKMLSRNRLELRGKSVVVTGASSGIGKELALQLAQRGAKLILVARREDQLQQTAAACLTRGAASVVTCAADITHADTADRISAEVLRQSPNGLDLLVLNAGRGAIAAFDSNVSRNEKMAKELMDVNYYANVRIIGACLNQLLSAKGRMLVISSVSGVLATPQRTLYCASKFALQGFCNSLRSELRSKGVGITVVCPGLVRTEFHDKVITADGKPLPRDDHGFMAASECARLAIEAATSEKDEVVLTASANLGYCLRPLIPRVVDGFAARRAEQSVKQQAAHL